MSWRRLLMQVHPVEPGNTHVSYYTSSDAQGWVHLTDDMAHLPERQELLDENARVIYVPSSRNITLEDQQRFIGIVSDKYTRTELLLVGPDGPLPVNNQGYGGAPALRGSDVLPLLAPSGLKIGEGLICFWDVSGEQRAA